LEQELRVESVGEDFMLCDRNDCDTQNGNYITETGEDVKNDDDDENEDDNEDMKNSENVKSKTESFQCEINKPVNIK